MHTDSPWKEILDQYFPDFTRMLFPELYASVDWSRGFRSLDKELARLGGGSRSGSGARSGRSGNKGTLFVDKLMSVYGRDGKDKLVLVHVEIQAQTHDGFARRMFEYYTRIFSKHLRPVVSLAVLADTDLDWRPSEYEIRFGGCRARLDFPVAKLMDCRGFRLFKGAGIRRRPRFDVRMET